MNASWHIVTGEYPPEQGGIGDYSAELARGLAARGAAVHVWCPPAAGGAPDAPGVEVHRLGSRFDGRALDELGRGLDRTTAPRIVLVQYTPNAFGRRGANLPFCLWLLRRRRHATDDVRVMFHEPYFCFAWQRPRRNALAGVHRVMAHMLLRASLVAYLSSQSWEAKLRPYAWPAKPRMVWLPVPATIPWQRDPAAVDLARARLTSGAEGSVVLGHFGTYAEAMAPIITAVFAALLRRHPRAIAVFLGLNADRFASRFRSAHPDVASRVASASRLDRTDVSIHLQACDVLIQPYPDGATTRRTSLMAALANGVATVTTLGALSETVWSREAGVVVAPADDEAGIAAAASDLIEQGSAARRALGEAGRRAYQEQFSLDRTLDVLCGVAHLAVAQ